MALQTDPRLELVKQQIKNGDKAAARNLLLQILQADNSNVEALYLFTFVAKSRQEAEKVLTRILHLDPFHYRARAALNKLQERSVEQLPKQATPTSLQSPGTAQRRSLMPFIILAIVLLVGASLIGFVLLAQDSTPEENLAGADVSVTPEMSPTIMLTNTQIANNPVITLEDLPPTWTPAPSLTTAPSQTPAPTWTTRPTQTQYPSLTPTVAEVAFLDFQVTTYIRLYNQYLELIARTSNTQDSQALQDIEFTFGVLIESLTLSEYEAVTDEGALAYLEIMVELFTESQLYARLRADHLIALADCQETRSEEICQNDEVISTMGIEVDRQAETVRWLLQDAEASLFVVSKEATATAQWEDRVNTLRTPTQTPILLPSAVSNN